MSQPNQFTKAAELGTEVAKAQNQFTTGKRVRHDDGTRDKMRSERALKFLDKTVKGKGNKGEKPSFGDRIAAAKAMIPFGKPMLSSVENKDSDPLESMTLEEQMEQLRTLITTHPEFIQALGLSFAPSQVTANEPTQLVPTIIKPIVSTGT